MLKRGFQFAPGYRLQEFLGRGQFGQVWRATAPGGAAAAVKFIDLSDGQGQKEYDGVRRVKQIRHANLMPITAIWLLDAQGQVIEEAPDEAMETIDLTAPEPKGQSGIIVGVEPSWLVVSMLLGGKSLQQRLRECIQEGLPGIPPKELISYMDESAKGIDFLNAPQHDLGEGPIAIQHSDVKPANIVLIGSSAVVCDFGLARILTRNQVTATSAAGTPAYMAPEAISGKPARTSDQYSLAVTYYHLRTGALPVNDGSLWEVLDAHRQGKLKLGLVSEAEQAVIRKATNLDWEKRFDTNVEMVDALRDALRAEGHTKPSFVPPVGSGSLPTSAVNASGATVVVADDPTATIDTARMEDNEATIATKPFMQAEQPTGEHFLNEPLPQLDDRASADQSFYESVKRQPKWIAGLLVASLFVFLTGVGYIFSRDPIVTERGADELFHEALSVFDDDQTAAVALFSKAMKNDPGLAFVKMKKLSGHKSAVLFAAVTPDGKQLVTAADSPLLWDMTASDIKPVRLTDQGLIEAIALNPDGDLLVTAGFGSKPSVWDLKQDDVAGSAIVLAGQTDDSDSVGVRAVAWHPLEPIVVTTTNVPDIGIWKLGRTTHSVTESHKIPTLQTMTAAAIDPKGRWFVTISDSLDGPSETLAYRWGEVSQTLTSAGTPKPISLTSEDGARPTRIAFASDQNDTAVLVVADDMGGITLYQMTNPPSSESIKPHNAQVESLYVLPASDTDNPTDVVVSGASDGSVHHWQLQTSREQQHFFGTMSIASVDVSADGHWVAVGSWDGSVWLWNANATDWTAIQLVTDSTVHVVRIDPMSKWLMAGCEDGTVRIWDLKWAKLLAMEQPTPSSEAMDGPSKKIETKSLTL